MEKNLKILKMQRINHNSLKIIDLIVDFECYHYNRRYIIKEISYYNIMLTNTETISSKLDLKNSGK